MGKAIAPHALDAASPRALGILLLVGQHVDGCRVHALLSCSRLRDVASTDARDRPLHNLCPVTKNDVPPHAHPNSFLLVFAVVREGAQRTKQDLGDIASSTHLCRHSRVTNN